MKFSHAVTVVCLNVFFVALASADITIRDYPPNTPINGAVVPSEAIFSPALKQGESLIVVIGGKTAMRLNVVEGEVNKFSSRFKLPESGTITYERFALSVPLETAKKYVEIKDGVVPDGVAAKLVKGTEYFKEKAARGSYKCLAYTENGFGNVLVLKDDGFKIELIGSNIASNRLYIGIDGNFSSGVMSTLIDNTDQLLR